MTVTVGKNELKVGLLHLFREPVHLCYELKLQVRATGKNELKVGLLHLFRASVGEALPLGSN